MQQSGRKKPSYWFASYNTFDSIFLSTKFRKELTKVSNEGIERTFRNFQSIFIHVSYYYDDIIILTSSTFGNRTTFCNNNCLTRNQHSYGTTFTFAYSNVLKIMFKDEWVIFRATGNFTSKRCGCPIRVYTVLLTVPVGRSNGGKMSRRFENSRIIFTRISLQIKRTLNFNQYRY